MWPHERERIASLLREGSGFRLVARVFGTSRSGTFRHWKNHVLARQPPPPDRPGPIFYNSVLVWERELTLRRELSARGLLDFDHNPMPRLDTKRYLIGACAMLR